MVVKLTNEDKLIFKEQVKSANAVEIVAIYEFINNSSLSEVDKKFCNSQLGKRSERILKNVVKNKGGV